MTFPSSASQQYHAGPGVVGNIHTANIGTPQGQKVLLLKEINPKQEQEQEQEGENENAYPALAVAADTSSEDQGGGESTDAEATSLNGKLVMSSTIPGLVEKTRPLVAQMIFQTQTRLEADQMRWTRPSAVIVDRFGMLLFCFQDKEIEGVPITPELVSEVQKAEMQEGKDTGKGSVAARLQAAAAYNVQEHVMLPVATASLGTAQEVRTSKEEKRETLKHVASGTRETKSAH
ncbi:hypothetical protein BDL97_09G078500 [Sphagnum fallax]|nr:hypothetical protein BDL97_09G078500 [Sphagnum fallax]